MCKGVMEIDPELIGFDIDGVVADTMEAFIRLARDNYGVDTIRPEDITCYMVEECLDVDPAMVADIFENLLEEPLSAGLKPMAGALPVLKELAAKAPLTFVTARPRELPIAQWLKTLLGDDIFAQTRLVAMGEHDGKTDHIRKLGIRYFVDDRLQTCLMLSRQGITPIVYRQPWNDVDHGLAAVSGWDDIRALCRV